MYCLILTTRKSKPRIFFLIFFNIKCDKIDQQGGQVVLYKSCHKDFAS